MHTIIGANPFHGPVRDGKAWFQAAVAARLAVDPQRAQANGHAFADRDSETSKMGLRSH